MALASVNATERRPRRRSSAPPPENPFLALLPNVKREIDARLERFFADQLERVAPYGSEVTVMLDALARFTIHGGKRLRPALLAVGFRVVEPRASLKAAFDAGLALELLHSYLLVHDDWMDQDDLRRGAATVHASLARHFKDKHKGHSTAILAGDFAAGLATSALARVAMPSGSAPAVLECFARMQVDAILGQELDVAGVDHDPELAYALKTGSYTVRGPLHMGALLAGGSPATLRSLERFATPVGIAFQLADDLLSAFGESSVTGKKLGNDLRAGKRTPLLLLGLSRTKGADLRALKAVVGNAAASDAAVRRALSVLEASGARAAIEARIAELVAKGLDGLGSGIQGAGRELLAGAALALSSRTR
jgi:geranylgeranyl diphosphate synthase type I